MSDAKEAELVRAVDRAERTGTTAQLANALDQLAAHHHRRQSYSEAAGVYARAIGIWRQILGAEHPVIGTQLINLGTIYLHLGDLPAAEPLFRQAVGIFEADVEFDDIGVVEALEAFVLALQHVGRHEDAERVALRVRKIASVIHETVRA